jgi:uncharacterized membrane-anchored protein
MTVPWLWRWAAGAFSVDHIVSRKPETYYWAASSFECRWDTALGDFFSDDSGLG